jgi:hypothetical protein
MLLTMMQLSQYHDQAMSGSDSFGLFVQRCWPFI